MQGAAKDGDRYFIAMSYGRNSRSTLKVGNSAKWSEYSFAPGLEDLHVSKTSDNLWLLTEFGENERYDTTAKRQHLNGAGGNNARVVLAIRRGEFE